MAFSQAGSAEKTPVERAGQSSPIAAAGFSGPVDESLIQRLVARLLEARRCECILLFGSRAYGQAHRDSDIDLLVVTETERDPCTVAGELYYALSPRDFSIDLVVMTPEIARRRRQRFDPFFKEITSKGRILHGALP